MTQNNWNCKFSHKYINKIILAPMVRIGTLPMRLLALAYGADLVYTEELIDFKLLKSKRKVNDVLQTVDYVDQTDGTVVFRTCAKERDQVILQLGTCDPERALRVGKLIEKDVAGLDINMGCPKEFSIKGGMGAALLNQPDKAVAILKKLVTNLSIPVTCKIRVFKDTAETIALCEKLQSTGIAAIAIHGRTKEERPQHPNRNYVLKELAQILKVPVIANGGSKEIEKFEDIEKFQLETGCSSVMLARAAEWNCSIFSPSGKVGIDVIIKEYLKYAIDYDNAPANTKYCIQNILKELQNTPMGKKFLEAQTMEQISTIWGMDTYCREKQKSLREMGLHSRRDVEPLSIEPQFKKPKLEDADVFRMSCSFLRSAFPSDIDLPKTRLLAWTRERRILPPCYNTIQQDKLFQSVVTVNGEKFGSSYWEKNKRWAEQSAAIVCLLKLDFIVLKNAIFLFLFCQMSLPVFHMIQNDVLVPSGHSTVDQETQCGFEEFMFDDTAFAITLWKCEELCGLEKVKWTESTESIAEDCKLTLDCTKLTGEKRKAEDCDINKDLKKAKLETKALKAKRPGFTDDRYNETSYFIENGLRKVYPYYFTFTTFTKGRWVGEKIIDVFAKEFRAHPAEEYARCIKAGTLTVNYEKVDTDYRLKHNDLLANIVHRHEVPVTSDPITIVHVDEDVVVVNKPASIPVSGIETADDDLKELRHETPVLAKPIRVIHVDEDIVVLDKPGSLPVHPCGRYRHNTVVFILAKEYNLKNLRTIHRLDRLTSGLLLFGRTPKKARQLEHQIRNRLVQKEYVCRVEGEFPSEQIECTEPIEVVSYKIGVCRVSSKGKSCSTTFEMLGYSPSTNTSIVLCKPLTGRMHQIRVHLQYLGYPVVNDPLYNHTVFGPEKGKGGNIGKTDDELVRDIINIHNAENWLGMEGDSELSMFKTRPDLDDSLNSLNRKGSSSPVDDEGDGSREPSPCGGENSPSRCSLGSPVSLAQGSPSTPSGGAVVRSSKVTVATQTGHEAPDLTFQSEKMTADPHCYECKVRYRDPKPKDLVMYLHAWKYRGPGWEYETQLPDWAKVDWVEPEE